MRVLCWKYTANKNSCTHNGIPSKILKTILFENKNNLKSVYGLYEEESEGGKEMPSTA